MGARRSRGRSSSPMPEPPSPPSRGGSAPGRSARRPGRGRCAASPSPVSVTVSDRPPPSPGDVHGDPAAGRRGAQGVADEVGDHLGEPVGVDAHGHRCRGRRPRAVTPASSAWGRSRSTAVPTTVRQVDRGAEWLEPALLGAGQRERSSDEPPHPAHLVADLPEAFGGGRRQDPVDHPLDVAVDDGERGAHLVRDLAEQPHPARLGLARARRPRVLTSSARARRARCSWGRATVRVVAVRRRSGRVVVAHRVASGRSRRYAANAAEQPPPRATPTTSPIDQGGVHRVARTVLRSVPLGAPAHHRPSAAHPLHAPGRTAAGRAAGRPANVARPPTQCDEQVARATSRTPRRFIRWPPRGLSRNL